MKFRIKFSERYLSSWRIGRTRQGMKYEFTWMLVFIFSAFMVGTLGFFTQIILDSIK